MPSRRPRKSISRSGTSPFERGPGPSRIRELRREAELPKRQPTIAPRMILVFGVVVVMALGLRILSQFLKSGAVLLPDQSVSDSNDGAAIRHSFVLPDEPKDAVQRLLNDGVLDLVPSTEMMVSGRDVYVPMGRWIVIRSPLGWGAFQLSEIARHGTDPAKIECHWRFQSNLQRSLADGSVSSGTQRWAAEAATETDKSATSGETPKAYAVDFHCGPIELVWREFLGVSLPMEPPVAIAVASQITPEAIRLEEAGRTWVMTGVPVWPAQRVSEPADFPGRPPEPVGS